MNPSHDKKLAAMAALVARTGATQMQVRYSDDEQPVVWFVVAVYPNNLWETGAGHDATQAAGRLLEAVIDGGVCCLDPHTNIACALDMFDDTDDNTARNVVLHAANNTPDTNTTPPKGLIA